MRLQLLRVFLAGLAALGLWIPQAPAASAPANEPIPTRLSERHPATLAGRMDRRQSTYVDLYAPLTPAEQAKVVGYRTQP
ncbi:MAG: hypothetical protein H6830_02965 [Planctomycetes bacterium]|nr:hypothetical protein [Planctomycetota bacterium]MCB9910096.1 hypothetical protein [Planctomycetota bacterium]MCB9913357.1 hypothetical protein [Planctomycetota bacterium]HPF15107.1 hypothetical protein [Planctomycetota bacterium]HRV82768.1 hypothetical protein [Planctomycetota bacterium]